MITNEYNQTIEFFSNLNLKINENTVLKYSNQEKDFKIIFKIISKILFIK